MSYYINNTMSMGSDPFAPHCSVMIKKTSDNHLERSNHRMDAHAKMSVGVHSKRERLVKRCQSKSAARLHP